MKRIYKGLLTLLTVSAFVGTASLTAAPAYISSLNAKMHSSAKSSAPVVMKLRRGQAVNVTAKQGSWVKVAYAGKQGWVRKFFTSRSKPGNKYSILGNASANARVHARKRASSEVTAASARGLDDDSNTAILGGRARDLQANAKGFDPRVLENMEATFVSEQDLTTFLSDGKLQ